MGVVGWVTGSCSGIRAGSTYELVAHFRAEGIPSSQESVWVNLTWRRDASDPRPRVAYLSAVTREGDWWQVSGRLRAPESATIADISLGLRQAPDGRLWWDDVSLREVPAGPPRRIRLATTLVPRAEHNPAGWRKAIERAGDGKADVVCLGELPPIVVPDPGTRPTIPGAATAVLAELARKYHMLIIVSLPEWKGDVFYNTAVIIGRDGDVLGTYRKSHLPEVEVERGSTPGSELPVFDTDIGRIGLQICYDHFFPEVARVLALKGAEIIFTPIAADERAAYREVAVARAVDNSVFYVTSTRGDPSSLIVDPSGRVLAEATGNPEVVFADVDLDAPHYEFELSVEGEAEFRHLWPKERRPSLYRELTEER